MASNLSTWQPDENGLREIIQLLKESQSSDNQVQRDVQTKLEQLNHHPDFNKYLIYIMTRCKAEAETTRSLAGLILKNNVRVKWDDFHASTQNLIKTECMEQLADSSALIRATIGILTTTIVSKAGLKTWPDLLPRLCAWLDSGVMEAVDGAFSTLQKICEDATEMDSSYGDAATPQPLDVLVPKFIHFFSYQVPKIRAYALACVNCFILHRIAPIQPHMEEFLQKLFSLAMDTDAEVKKQILRAIVTLLEVQPDVLYRDLNSIIGFMLMRTRDDDEMVALEACEFWLSVADNQVCQQALIPHLPQLVPLLLERMCYSVTDMVLLRAEEEEDEMKPDRQEDIRPRFHKAKTHSFDHVPGPAGDHAQPAPDADDADGDDDDEETTEWNLRKCSAAALDVLSNVFHDNLLPVLLPVLDVILKSPDWMRKESAILALGAVAEGCAEGMSGHLPALFPFLLQCMQDPKPLVRSITCWTLSRYAGWIVSEDPDRYFKPLLGLLLQRVLDSNKKVQEAGCSAFATLEEEAGVLLVPHLDVIVRSLVAAFNKYQSKNLLILYDAIGTLAESVGHELNRAEYIALLMEPLIFKWNGLRPDDKSLFPLLECLSSVATAMATGFMPYVAPVFQRSMQLIERSIHEQNLFLQHPDLHESPDRDCLIVALDLVSGLSEGVGSHLEPLVINSKLMLAVQHCIRDPVPEVRQSAFALIGDLAKAAFNAERPFLNDFIMAMAQNMNPEQLSVCNNATWALGEVSIRLGADIRQYVHLVLESLICLMNRPNTQKTLLENTAITLGRLGWACPDLLANQLHFFIKPWCHALRNVRDNDEKASAFRGLCMMIGSRANPLELQDFVAFCDGVASWISPDQELKGMFQQILSTYKAAAPAEQWPAFMEQFPAVVRDRLQKHYGL
ncbi:transportin-2-like [Paramacrobiotus metropolitanus]|uniref:transportin-2-like n=1 Tax=Paramacrobiotus metropolitanus TaxID=2943436 RepID=UPI0024459117|nr:transportin-2-like [Paramacrobiotus metropolitanus]